MDDESEQAWDRKYEAEGKAAALYGIASGLELRKINFQERMSDETNCFVADIYRKGKKVGQASNDGHGGNTEVHISEMSEIDDTHLERWVDDTIEAYLKAKDKLRIAKWIDKNVAKFTAKGWLTAVITQGNKIELVSTKCPTTQEFLTKNPKFAKPATTVEIRR